LRAALPADKMEKVIELYHQGKQNESESNSLFKKQQDLKSRLMDLGKEKDELLKKSEQLRQQLNSY
jgi:hypothetical protein